MKILNVGIVGFGLSGKYLQSPFFESNAAFNLKTIVTTQKNVQAYYAKVATAKTLQDVLVDETIDLVSICTPNNTHFEYAKQSLLAGKHVLVEKPFTATSKEAEYLISLANEKNKVLAIFQNRRFDSDFITIQKIINDKLVGSVNLLQINFNRYKPALNTKKWKETVSPCTGIIYDLGPHIIDQAIALFGVPQSVSGKRFTERLGSKIDDAFEIILNYKELQVILKSSLLVQEETPRYIVKGTLGNFVKYGVDAQEDQLKEGMLPNDLYFGIEPISQSGKLIHIENGQKFEEMITTEKGNWVLFFENLYAAIVFGKKLLVKPLDVVEQIKIIEAIKIEGCI